MNIEIVTALHAIGCIKFGQFELTRNFVSPFEVDLMGKSCQKPFFLLQLGPEKVYDAALSVYRNFSPALI